MQGDNVADAGRHAATTASSCWLISQITIAFRAQEAEIKCVRDTRPSLLHHQTSLQVSIIREVAPKYNFFILFSTKR